MRNRCSGKIRRSCSGLGVNYQEAGVSVVVPITAEHGGLKFRRLCLKTCTSVRTSHIWRRTNSDMPSSTNYNILNP